MALDIAVALITLAEAKTYLKITTSGDDTIIEDLIDQISGMVETYLGRRLTIGSLTEYYDGNGTSELILRRYPIVTITSLHIADNNRIFDDNAAIVIADDLIIYTQRGIIRLFNNGGAFTTGRANIRVIYDAGWDSVTAKTVPHDIQLAVRQYVGQQYMKYVKRRHDIVSQNIGERTTTYVSDPLPKNVKALLDRHKQIVLPPDYVYHD